MDDGLDSLKKDELHEKATSLGFDKAVSATTKDELISFIRRQNLEALAVDLGYQPDPSKATDEQLQQFTQDNSLAGAAETRTPDNAKASSGDVSEPATPPKADDAPPPAADGLVRVKFLRSYTVRDEEGRTYSKDEVCDLRPDSAEHFTRRGVAELA